MACCCASSRCPAVHSRSSRDRSTRHSTNWSSLGCSRRNGERRRATAGRNTTSSRPRGKSAFARKPPAGAGQPPPWPRHFRPGRRRSGVLARIRHRWRALFHRREWENNLNDEIQGHVDQRVEDLIRRGLTPEEAERRARIELGSREAYKEQCREEHGLRWPDEIKQDMLYAARLLRRSPGFTAVAIVSLALGIGANTVVFSAINVLLLKPLPVSSPGELRFVERDHFPWHYYSRYLDMRDRNQTFSGLIGYEFVGVGIETGEFTDWAPAYLATGNYFNVLGVRPRLGRFFGPEDDLKSGAKPVVVLSYASIAFGKLL